MTREEKFSKAMELITELVELDITRDPIYQHNVMEILGHISFFLLIIRKESE